MPKKSLFLALLSAGLILVTACGGDSGPAGTPGPSASAATARPISPPLEGPPRAVATERTNFRELPEFELPSPADLPEPPGDAKGPEFHPPAEPQCPEGWQGLERPVEGFRICYPKEWSIQGHGYVSAGAEDRWYSVGVYFFRDDVEVAHVSVYVVNPFARPFAYTRDCKQAYRVTFAGESAALCPDYPGVPPEERIIAYHIRRGDLDYFVNVVPKFTYDPQAGKYLDTWDREAEARAIQIAQTLQLTPIISPQ